MESGGNVISEAVEDINEDDDDDNEDDDSIDVGNTDEDDNSIKRTGRLLFQQLEASKVDNKTTIKV